MATRSNDRVALERARRLARSLDSRFRVPGTPIRFGWDAILGLVPGVGDAATLVPAALIIATGARVGVGRRVLVGMILRTTLDLVVGSVPVLGDALDVVLRSNERNVAAIERHVEGATTRP